jgi:hypothetical protein
MEDVEATLIEAISFEIRRIREKQQRNEILRNIELNFLIRSARVLFRLKNSAKEIPQEQIFQMLQRKYLNKDRPEQDSN